MVQRVRKGGEQIHGRSWAFVKINVNFIFSLMNWDSTGLIYIEELTGGNSVRECEGGYKKLKEQKQNDSFVRHELLMSTS